MGILLRIVNQSSIENSEFVIVSVQKFIQEQYVVVTIITSNIQETEGNHNLLVALKIIISHKK